jgi:SAM-dependent methyltransferase
MAAEEAVTDACEFLGVTRPRFFELALAWPELGAALWERSTPETFYTGWTGDTGRAAVAANVMDQFTRQDVWGALSQVMPARGGWLFMDYGCGTGSASFPFLGHCAQAVMVDVPNLNQEFLRWRLQRHGLDHVAVLSPDQAVELPLDTFDLVACVDVLEHLPEPTQVFQRLDAWLRCGGLLIQRSPWAHDDEELGEHLPEATADWHRSGGGAEQIGARYEALLPMAFGAVYHKSKHAWAA